MLRACRHCSQICECSTCRPPHTSFDLARSKDNSSENVAARVVQAHPGPWACEPSWPFTDSGSSGFLYDCNAVRGTLHGRNLSAETEGGKEEIAAAAGVFAEY
ncbi:hypothetical protein KIL84_014505 [Mauremys mutica]|uniref:Uncharacterized protein n=1 Tax=Mauremys mutica TaxID=74926 RepID=A0A9D3XNK2_9SAUR|nr:hypothetical protein KIL84_014505 [Mauremys mutica]